jgi:hypothetical protein
MSTIISTQKDKFKNIKDFLKDLEVNLPKESKGLLYKLKDLTV